jgi:hypothetical protein
MRACAAVVLCAARIDRFECTVYAWAVCQGLYTKEWGQDEWGQRGQQQRSLDPLRIQLTADSPVLESGSSACWPAVALLRVERFVESLNDVVLLVLSQGWVDREPDQRATDALCDGQVPRHAAEMLLSVRR